MKKKALTRRSFLRMAALAVGGATVAACEPKVVKETVVVEQVQEKVVKETVVVEGTPQVVEKVITSVPQQEAPGKLVFWPEWGGKDSDALQVAVNKFSEETGNEVEFLPIRDHARILASMGAGNPPDLMMTWDSAAVGTWSANGAIRELTPYIEGSGFDMDTLHPHGIAAAQMLGRQIGMPLSNYLNTVYYWNKVTFDEVGLDPEVAPETWGELYEYEKEITIVEDGAIQRLGFIPNYGQYSSNTIQYAFGGSPYAEDGRVVNCDNEGMIDALEYTRRFYEDYGPREIARFNEALVGDADSPTFPFYTGQGASFITGEWQPSSINMEAAGEGFDYGVGYMQYPEDKPELKGTMVANSNPMIIPAAAENPDGAWKLIEFLERADISAEMCLIVGNASPVKEGVQLMIEGTDNEKYRWMLSEVWTQADIHPMTQPSPVGRLYSDVLDREVEKVRNLQKEPEEAMQDVKNEVQPELDAALERMGLA